MAKQVSNSDETEVDAVAREIFTATAIQLAGRSVPEHIADLAYQSAETFVAYKRAYRQNTAKVKGDSSDAV